MAKTTKYVIAIYPELLSLICCASSYLLQFAAASNTTYIYANFNISPIKFTLKFKDVVFRLVRNQDRKRQFENYSVHQRYRDYCQFRYIQDLLLGTVFVVARRS